MPRNGVDIILKDKEALDEYFELIDVFKFSGRLVVLDEHYKEDEGFFIEGEKSLEEKANGVLKSRLRVLQGKQKPYVEKVYESKEGEHLLDFLKTCKNECYSCHLCEKVFGVDEFDSLIELKGNFWL